MASPKDAVTSTNKLISGTAKQVKKINTTSKRIKVQVNTKRGKKWRTIDNPNYKTPQTETGNGTKDKKKEFWTKEKLQGISEGLKGTAEAIDPLTRSGTGVGGSGSPLGDKGADINPYTVVRGESDILSAKERKRLKSLNA